MKSQGLSLTEIVISFAIVSILVAVIVNAMMAGIGSWRYEDSQAHLVQNCRKAMLKMSRDIRQARIATLVITPIDANRDNIDIEVDIDTGVNEPGDIETVTYSLLDDGHILMTIFDTDSTITDVLLTEKPIVTQLHFTQEYDKQVAIRFRADNRGQIMNLSTKAWPRN